MVRLGRKQKKKYDKTFYNTVFSLCSRRSIRARQPMSLQGDETEPNKTYVLHTLNIQIRRRYDE